MFSWKQSIKYGSLVLIALLIGSLSKQIKLAKQNQPSPVNQPSKAIDQAKNAPSPTSQSDQSSENYTIINKKNGNYKALITIPSPSEKEAKQIANKIKQKECTVKCNMIELYDDRQALSLDLQYSLLDSSEEMTKWKEKNYVFVADHYIGNMLSGEFSYYPFKDWYYKELKSNQ